MATAKETNWTSAPIAICLSGGGYRAAGYHLGTLAYMNRVELLGNLSALSTISGGSFTGAMYVLSLVKKQPFEDFYQQFYQLLDQTHLIQRGLSHISEPAQNVSGRRNVVVSMAQVYGKTFFRNEHGDSYLLKDILDSDATLPAVSFNATEFRTGVAFRFQNRGGAFIGNGNIPIPLEHGRNIRIADVVAASSCFPGGFEPFAFPDDFVWPEKKVPAEITRILKKNDLPPRVALMDGGIYDNQGADTLDLLVGKDAKNLSMFVLSDVDRRDKDMYPYPQEAGLPGFAGRRTLGQLNFVLRSLSAICLLSLVSLGYLIFRSVETNTFTWFPDFFTYLVPFVLAGGTFTLLHRGRDAVKKILRKVPQANNAAWRDIKGLTLSQVLEMVELRISSLSAISGSIFMRRIRALVFKGIYSDKRYAKKRLGSQVYDLNDAPSPGKDLPSTSDALRELSLKAANTPTLLFFQNPSQLPNLVATGQATMCFNLIKLVEERFGADPQAYPQDVKDLWGRLTEDWSAFCQNPFFLQTL